MSTAKDELFGSDELSVIITALHAYQQETQGYLESCDRRLDGHDDCCKASIARRVNQEAQRTSLKWRLTTINAALSHCGARP